MTLSLFVVARAYLKSLPPKNVVYHTVNSVTKGGRFPRTPTHPGKRHSISLYKHDGRFRQDKGGVGLCIDKQSCCVYWLLPPGSSNQAAGLSSTCRVRLCSLIVFFFSSPRTIESYVHINIPPTPVHLNAYIDSFTAAHALPKWLETVYSGDDVLFGPDAIQVHTKSFCKTCVMQWSDCLVQAIPSAALRSNLIPPPFVLLTRVSVGKQGCADALVSLIDVAANCPRTVQKGFLHTLFKLQLTWY